MAFSGRRVFNSWKNRRGLIGATAAVASENPYGAVVAANHAVQTVLEQLASYCAEAARRWQSAQHVRAAD